MQTPTTYSYCCITNCLQDKPLKSLVMYAHSPDKGAEYKFLYYLAGFASLSELTLKDHFQLKGLNPQATNVIYIYGAPILDVSR